MMDIFKGDQHLPTNLTSAKAHFNFTHWEAGHNPDGSGPALFFGGYDAFSPDAWDSWISNHERNPAFASKLIPNDFPGLDPLIDEAGSAPFSYDALPGDAIIGQIETGFERTDPHEFQFASGGALATVPGSNMVVQTDFDLNGLRDFQIVIADTNASVDFVF
jgi:hypothetical protein